MNSYWPVIIPQFLTNAYNVFLLRQFMMTVSLEMDDAARIDGAGWFRIYWQIMLPMAKAALGVIAIQAFRWNWNNFMGAYHLPQRASQVHHFAGSAAVREFYRPEDA